MSPSGERSNGMSSALTTLGSVSYILRNSCDAAMSSMRRLAVLLPTWAKSRSSRVWLIRVSELFLPPRLRGGPGRDKPHGAAYVGAPHPALPEDGEGERERGGARSQILRRAEVLVAGRGFVGRIGHDLLEQQVHEQEQRLCFEHQQDRLVVGAVVEMLVDACAF